MDLKRSVNFFDSEDHDSVKQLLLSVANKYPQLGYYQGMNYIAIYVYYFF